MQAMAGSNSEPDDDEITFPEHLWEKESRELRTAIYDDWKRKAINDAKFRACDQHVDYPTFANLVSVAHLKPVERKTPGEEFAEGTHVFKGTRAPSWSFNSAGEEEKEEKEEDWLPTLLELKPEEKQRLTDMEFVKQWRRLNKDVFLQMAFLTGIDPGELPEIFKVELPPNVLAETLATICTCFRAGDNEGKHPDPDRQRLLRAACAPREVDEDWTVNMLEAMSQCGRFPLAIIFVDEKTRAMVRALVSHLVESPWCEAAAASSSRLSRIHKITEVYRLQARPL